MASVNVTGIQVLNNPCSFVNTFQFEITFECLKELNSDLEWKLTYVGSAESEECDQELDSVLVGPIPLGVNRFIFETPAPDPNKIPKQDLLGVTVALISCLYKGKEFIRIGYYVNNEYDDPELLKLKSEDGGMDIDKSDNEEEEDIEEIGDDDDDDEDEDVDENAKGKASSSSSAPSLSISSSDVDGDQVMGDESSQDAKLNHDGKENGSMNNANVKMDEEIKKEAVLPENFSVAKIRRHILDDKPRLTRFLIDWD